MTGPSESDIRKGLDREDELEAQAGLPSAHKVTPGKFLYIALDLEDFQ